MDSKTDSLKKLLARVAGWLPKFSPKQVDAGIIILLTALALLTWVYLHVTPKTNAGFSFLRNIEERSLDERFRLRGTRTPDDRIVIVGIDERTLQRVNSWPLARSAYAKLVDRLHDGGARVVAFDVTFPTPEKNSAIESLKKLEGQLGPSASPAVRNKIRELASTSDNDVIFAEAMKRADNVILGHIFLDEERTRSQDKKAVEAYYNVLWGRPFPQMQKVTDGKRDFDLNKAWAKNDGQVGYGIEPNIPLLAESAKAYGFFNEAPDGDGTYRRAVLVYAYQEEGFYASLPFEAVRLYEGLKDQDIVGYLHENGLERIEFGSHRLETGHDGTVLLNYAGPYHTYKHYSMSDVIDGTVPNSIFKDKIVLVGATAIGIGDLRITPFQSKDYMGVEIHANTIDNLLHSGEKGRGFLHRGLNEEIIDIVAILVFGLGMGLFFGRTKPLYATFGAVVALGLYGVSVFEMFKHFGMWISFVIPAATLMVNYAAITSFRMAFEEREKRKIRKSFSQYVSPGVIGLIQENPKKYFHPGGEEKELTIMFSDIRSFTTIAEGLTPNELVLLLNEYLGEMTDILFKTWGTLDKYIGDAIMGFWGSPFPQEDHAIRACTCALEMSARLDELNLKWEREGRKQLNIGIGLNSGPVNVGNMGSSKRLAWTVMGDNVNLASRLEGQTKDYKTRILISESTYQLGHGGFVCRNLDKIRVKGKLKPVDVYELLAVSRDAASYADLLGRFSEAQSAYRRQNWDEAIQLFEALLTRYPDDGPSHTMLKRSHEYVSEAPEPGWDGVYVAKTK